MDGLSLFAKCSYLQLIQSSRIIKLSTTTKKDFILNFMLKALTHLCYTSFRYTLFEHPFTGYIIKNVVAVAHWRWHRWASDAASASAATVNCQEFFAAAAVAVVAVDGGCCCCCCCCFTPLYSQYDYYANAKVLTLSRLGCQPAKCEYENGIDTSATCSYRSNSSSNTK